MTKRSRTGRLLARVISFLRGPRGCARVNTMYPGKTLLMKPPKANGALLTGTITKRTGMPFFSVSNSRFMRVFINVKTSGMHSLFGRTGRGTPYVMFVSRVSAVNGGESGTKCNKGSRHRRALGRLLARVSKFSTSGNIIVLTTAGQPSDLSPTLLHPKEFSHHVPIRLPSLGKHRRVLGIRTGGMELKSSVSFGTVTETTSKTSKTRLTGVMGRTTLHTIERGHGCMARTSLRRDVRAIVTKCRGGGRMLSSGRGLVISCRRVNRTLMTTLRAGSTPIAGVAVVPHASNTLKCAVRMRSRRHGLVARRRLVGGVTALAKKEYTRGLVFGSVAANTSGSVRRTAGLTETVVAHCKVDSQFNVITLRARGGPCLKKSDDLDYSPRATTSVSRVIMSAMGRKCSATVSLLRGGRGGLRRLTGCLCRGRAVAKRRFVRVLAEARALRRTRKGWRVTEDEGGGARVRRRVRGQVPAAHCGPSCGIKLATRRIRRRELRN